MLTVVLWRVLVGLGVRNIDWFVLAAFYAWVAATVFMRVAFPRWSRAPLAYVAAASIALVPAGIVWYSGAYDRVVANQGGQFGTPPVSIPPLAPFVTTSGLQLTAPTPAVDHDQCFAVTLCTPQTNAALRLRGGRIDDGFTIAAAEVARSAPGSEPGDDCRRGGLRRRAARDVLARDRDSERGVDVRGRDHVGGGCRAGDRDAAAPVVLQRSHW